MLVSELMTREPARASADERLSAAAGRMWEHDCGALPVVQDGRVVGMITDRDICMATWSRGLPPDAIEVISAMSTRLVSCQPTDTLEDVEKAMRSNQVRRLPVLSSDGRLVGIISLADIVTRAETTRSHDGNGLTTTLAGICQPAASPKSMRASTLRAS